MGNGAIPAAAGHRNGRRGARNRLLKRSFDIVVAVPLFVALMPLLVAAALAVLLTEGRPVFYFSNRYVGVNRQIRVLKFRTMVRDATSPRHRLNERFMRDGFLDIPVTCEVYTPVGRLLERLQIVELPQLANVLFHGLSLVGNRPLPRANVDLLVQFPAWERRFDSPAGITGIAQIVGKFNLVPAQRLHLESQYSRVYQEGNVAKCDILVIWHTVAAVLLRNKGISLERAEALLKSCLPDRE
jgi:lipopolysaccharide/colanic/teichoic acid biosynthesis glycosyltransferase